MTSLPPNPHHPDRQQLLDKLLRVRFIKRLPSFQ
jgi:hypothetical protein